MTLQEKQSALKDILTSRGRMILAFSGGVDSTYLAYALTRVDVPYLAITAISPTMPESDRQSVRDMVEHLGLNHRFIESREMENPDFIANTPERCFHCKDELFSRLATHAETHGYETIIDGSVCDDLSDHRPGFRAVKKHKVLSPLIEAGLFKADVRELSRVADLPTWNRPASPCLSSRFPYGIPIALEGLRRVEQAERWLRDHGFDEVRVRNANDTAKIEIKAESLPQIVQNPLRDNLVNHIKSLGFLYVTLDLEGFSSGRLNRVLKQDNTP